MEEPDRKTEERERKILWFFDLALLLKAVNGGFEILGAILVLIVSPSLVLKITEFLTSGELGQDSEDPVATALLGAAHTFTVHTHYLLAFYLVLHGAVKIILVMGIFRGKRIAYTLFMIALAIFGAYETYRGFARHELLLQALAVLDLAILLLTSHEYRRRYPPHSSVLDMRGDYAGR